MKTRIMNLTMASIFIITILYCASYPKETQPVPQGGFTAAKRIKEIIKGRTIRVEVFQFFGSPDLTTGDDDGNEVWNYNNMSYTTAEGNNDNCLVFWGDSRRMKSPTVKTFNLIITFDRKSIVKDYHIIKYLSVL